MLQLPDLVIYATRTVVSYVIRPASPPITKWGKWRHKRNVPQPFR